MSTPLYQSYQSARHFGSLDGLRFICITAVIWHHSTWFRDLGTEITLLSRGFLGVDFFFVLSGYLITTLLLREEERHGFFDLRHFYWRRLLRIVPVYFFVVGLNAAYAALVLGQPELLSLLPYYFLFLSNFLTEHIPNLTITWSLAVEEQYYLIWPLLLLLLPRRWILPVLLALITLNVLGHMGLLNWMAPTATHLGPLKFHLPPYAPILMGSVAAIALHNGRMFALLEPVLAQRSAILVSFALLIGALQMLPGSVIGWPAFVIHLAMCLVLVTAVMREDHMMRWALTNRVITRIGQISYGMYLYHLPLLVVGFKVLETLGLYSGPALFFFYYALTVIVSEISFRTLEAWFTGLRPRLKPRWARAA
ncbi:acyltransferase [uncultured Tateyamaria sp.]|uniref:acyltransferase family protein n=1 Tax=uncultured Tateyamaria sp. TaxID=455651 RepID=UPI002607562D|nr:acyltransferase [uncultured Tateyamaria sp.]